MAFSMQDLRITAAENAICYSANRLSDIAFAITRLAGDNIILGEDEALCISLGREGLLKVSDILEAYASSKNLRAKESNASGFDPFGDQASRGYLRNHLQVNDAQTIKMLEHLSFSICFERAVTRLATSRSLGYPELLGAHRIIFEALYPWAGIDRMGTSASLSISKGALGTPGRVCFAEPGDVANTVAYALRGTAAKAHVRKHAGAILGNLAFAHPFLDGNGRALLTFHREVCRRAGFEIDWISVETHEYLNVLSNEINQPNRSYMDDFLEPYIFSI